jgi:hypothetical protein
MNRLQPPPCFKWLQQFTAVPGAPLHGAMGMQRALLGGATQHGIDGGSARHQLTTGACGASRPFHKAPIAKA